MRTIYLDHHATTPVDGRVLEAMLPYFKERFANAASASHAPGRLVAAAVRRARAEVAALVGADPREIVFTGGATESNNLALKGAAHARCHKGRHLITVATEHKSVLDPCRRLELEGFRVTVLGVDREGLVDPKAVERAITPETILISVMSANNEIGTLQPVERIGRIARASGVLFHCDAVQSAGRVPFDAGRAQADLVSLSAHKLYGPKGVGALYVRKRGTDGVNLVPLFDGGAQETGLRSGTLNVPGIVGFGVAAALARKGMAAESRRTGRLRDRLLEALRAPGGLQVNGSLEHRLPNNLNVSFEGVEAGTLLAALPELALSAGSACLSTSPEPSYVLRALDIPDPRRRGAIRFGLGRFNTEKEVDRAARLVCRAVVRLRMSRT